jgi:hypothetical protein
MSRTEEEIAELLRALPPAPEAWVAGARELPRTRRELSDVIGRIETDEAFRREVEADVAAALGATGPEGEPLDPVQAAAIRAHLQPDR